MGRPRICLTMGDPCGIGPEVSAKLLAAPGTRERADFLLLGDREVFADDQRIAGVSLSAEEVASSSRDAAANGLALLHVPFRERRDSPPGEVHAASGRHVLEVLCRAAEIGRAGDADATMFAPLRTVSPAAPRPPRKRRAHLHGRVRGEPQSAGRSEERGGLRVTRPARPSADSIIARSGG